MSHRWDAPGRIRDGRWGGLCLTGALLLAATACKGGSNGSVDGSGGSSGAPGSGGTGGESSGGASGESGSGASGDGNAGDTVTAGSTTTSAGSGGTSAVTDGSGGTSTVTDGSGGSGGASSATDSSTLGNGGSAGEAPGVVCAADADCAGAGRVCDPLPERCVECLFDADCGDGERCQARHCVEAVGCQSSADCEDAVGTEACDATRRYCVECVTVGDCPGTADCIDHECRPYVACSDSMDCPSRLVCDVSSARCVQCVSDDECNSGAVCDSNVCRRWCYSDSPCAAFGQVCNLEAFGNPNDDDDYDYVCVECVNDADCPGPYHCSHQNECVLDACEPGFGTCEGNVVYACSASGHGYEYRSCSSTQSCVGGAWPSCEDWLCTPGAVECNPRATAVVTCAADGLSIESSVDCAENAEVCYQAECQALACAPDSYFCKDDAVHSCGSDGLSSTVAQTCADGEYCDTETAQCADLFCTPGAPACSDRIATTCNDAGDAYAAGGIDCAESDEFCVDGECQSCNNSILLLGDRSSAGNEAMRVALEAAGMAVTAIYDGTLAYAGTPDAAEFGAVVDSVGARYEYTGSYIVYQTSMFQSGQAAIAAAHAAGTGYVTHELASFQRVEFAATLNEITLLSYGTNPRIRPEFRLTSIGHPIWDGLPLSFTPDHAVGITFGQLQNGGVAIATCSGCDVGGAYPGAAVAVREGNGGRLVHLAHDGNRSNSYADANLLKMLVNAAVWAAGCK